MAEHVWEWFLELIARRSAGEFGGNPISFAEIDAFGRLTGARMRPWEINAICQMDDAYLVALAEKTKRGKAGDPPAKMKPATSDALKETFRRLAGKPTGRRKPAAAAAPGPSA